MDARVDADTKAGAEKVGFPSTCNDSVRSVTVPCKKEKRFCVAKDAA